MKTAHSSVDACWCPFAPLLRRKQQRHSSTTRPSVSRPNPVGPASAREAVRNFVDLGGFATSKPALRTRAQGASTLNRERDLAETVRGLAASWKR